MNRGFLLLIPLLLSCIGLVYCNDGCTFSKYTTFLQTNWNVEPFKYDLSESALLVIDMQKDFTFGSFGLPCFNSTPELTSLPARIAQMIKFFTDNNGYVVASKDWHPNDHCSFHGSPQQPCLNENTLGQIYQNNFPPHCVHSNHTGNPTTWPEGFRGADFVPEIAVAMTDAISAGKGGIVFKGFHPRWDSFSAFSMSNSTPQQPKYTGGYSPVKSYVPSKTDPIDNYYPTIQELNDVDQLISLAQILKNRGIKQIFVCGLVFDYCVRDSSIYGLLPENMGPETEMKVVVDLSRPAMDGSTFQIQVENFLLGSSERILSQGGYMLNHNVRFVKAEDVYHNNKKGNPKLSQKQQERSGTEYLKDTLKDLLKVIMG